MSSADTSSFPIALMRELMSSMTNWYGEDNWDPERFGAGPSTLKGALLDKFNRLLSDKVAVVPGYAKWQAENVSRIEGLLEGLSWLHGVLADEHSKEILVKVVAYRVLGHKRVKLPVNTDSYWTTRESMRSLAQGGEVIPIGFLGQDLRRFKLDEIGYPVELFFLSGGVFITFVLKQYEYGKRKPAVKAREGDYVIDGGGCWGDTALYFAHEVGERGRVYTFEFAPENMGVLERNVGLNPALAGRIEVVPRALWERSGEEIAYSPNGPGTSLAGGGQGEARATTVAIDDFVRGRELPRVDFIKMDIEGAELGALRGAERTLREFRPRLAISVYHREDDLVEIPRYLDGLGLGYEFFLDHFTIYGEETVLFAQPK